MYHQSQPQSPLSRLPAELRNLIYEYALYEPLGAQIRHEPSLLSTCKTIRSEAELMYYAMNNFTTTIHVEENIGHDLCTWLKLKAGVRMSLIRSLEVKVDMPGIESNAVDEHNDDDDDEEEEESEDDCSSLGFLQLMHIMSSIRTASFTLERPVERVVHFTLNGANDDERFEKIEDMSGSDQERFRGAKFLILSLVYGEEKTVEALEAEDCEERLEKLDAAIRKNRGVAAVRKLV